MTRLVLLLLIIFSNIYSTYSQIPAGYYDGTSGLMGNTLKTKLFTIIKGHIERSYNDLWTDFQTTDNNSNGKVWDMYSDVPGGTPSYEFTFGTNQCGTYSTEGDCYNREHSFPKSWWGGGTSSSDTMYTDLFHLVPTDGYVNNKRASYCFGEVGTASWTSTNGSKLGASNYPGYSGTVFEPIDDYKGDFARNYFYMATRYQNRFDSWASNTDMLDGTGFSSWALDMLIEWHTNDPVSQKELDRNDDVYGIQNNRNPFIDHPEWVDDIWNPSASSAPIFASGFPKSNNIANTSFDILVKQDKIGTAYYVVLSNGASTPSSAQIKAGEDASGSSVAANLKGSMNIAAANTSYTNTVSSLTASTDYDVYVVSEDNSSPVNLQSSATLVDVSTSGSGSGGSQTYAETFDEASLWTSSNMGSYNAKTYTLASPSHNDEFSTNSAVRESTNKYSSPYSWRLKNTSNTYLRYECEGTVESFSIYAARWDNSPKPNVTIRYSVDDGANYSTAMTFTGDDFSGDKVYKQFSHTLSSAITNDPGKKIYIEFLTTSGERMLYDDFEISFSTGSPSNSNESDIILNTSWNEPTNIDYTSYTTSSSLTTANAIEVAKFTIRDGGSDNTDTDTETTKLTDIEFTIDNYENIEAIAIFDGNTNVAEVTSVSSNTISFSSLTLEAADESTKDFSVYIGFKTNVTDNDNIKLTVSSATADASGSVFAAADAGAATTDNTGSNNKIIVTADKLDFSSNKPPSSVNTDEDFEVEVKATDANGNTDIDATNSIVLSLSTGSGTLSSASGLTQSLVNGVKAWSDVQYDTEGDFSIEAQTGSLTNKTSSTITCSAPAQIPDLIISEIADPKDTWQARFVELYNGSGSSIDFSSETFYLYEQANGGNWNGIQLTGTLAAGAMYVVAYSASDFNTAYGQAADLASGNINGNGDDGYFLYYGGDHSTGTLVDLYGVIDQDGTGKNWEYMDSRVVRTTSEQKSASKGVHTFDIADWTITDPANVADMTPGTKDDGQALPISLISFTFEKVDNEIVLSWETASETNNDYFTVERSYNLKDFENIGEVTGAGNSNEIIYYKLLDNTANLSQTIYYRLKQTDFDGKFSYSNILAVNSLNKHLDLIKSYTQNEDLSLLINSDKSDNLNILIFNINGQQLKFKTIEIQKGINEYKISLKGLLPGIYILQLINNKASIVNKFFY